MNKNMLKRKYLYVLLPLIALFTSCGTVAEYSYISKDVDFTQYTSYAFLPAVDSTKSASLYDNEIVLERVRSEVNAQMQERGFIPDPQDADVLILVHKMFDKETDRVRTPIYNSYNYYYPGFRLGYWYPYYYTYYNRVPYVYGNYEIQEINYIEGSIVIDIIDSDDNKLIWRGWSEDIITSPRFMDDIRKYVARIYENFPIKPGDRPAVDDGDIDMDKLIQENPDPRTSR